MLAAAALLLAAQPLPVPNNASFEFTGLPVLTRTDRTPANVRVVSHSVQVELDGEQVRVSTTTQLRNLDKAPLNLRIEIPRSRYGDDRSGAPTFRVEAAWDQKPLDVKNLTAGLPPTVLWTNGERSLVLTRSPQGTVGLMRPEGTHALRIRATLPLGRAGLNRKERILGYSLEGLELPIGTLDLAIRDVRREMFNLPRLTPRWGWQSGATGAFVRRTDFRAGGELVTATFYPDGFAPMDGDGR